MKYGFIGTGNMGGALVTACAKAVEPEGILLSNRSPEKARALAEKLGASCADNETIARDCDVIFLGYAGKSFQAFAAGAAKVRDLFTMQCRIR